MKTHRSAGKYVGLATLALALSACGQIETAQDSCGDEDGAGCVLEAPAVPPEALPPAGYVTKWSTCANFVESDAKLLPNSRIVVVRSDGTVPLQRAEPVAKAEDNFRRVLLSKLPYQLLGGQGVLRKAGSQQQPAVSGEHSGVVALALHPPTPVSFVKLGQAVTTAEADGSTVEWVVGSEHLGEPVENEQNGKVEYQDTCLRDSGTVGRDTSGWVAPGTDLGVSCIVEDATAQYNAYTVTVLAWWPLVNFVTAQVATANEPTTHPHPDRARYLGSVGGAYLYSGYGAALNDINGTERDEITNYIPGEQYCHMLVNGGYEVPGAKRPATKSLPAPGIVNSKTFISWRPVNPNVVIANDQEPAAPDPLEAAPPIPVPVDAADALLPL